jgi:hypothetical protein
MVNHKLTAAESEQARKELGYAGRGLSKYKHEPLPPLTRAAVERAIKHFAALSATPPAK